ncbi:MBL fold metallo-hydrolase [Caldisericum exile]|uniref:beta-lactamase n=1 Tax=Caldisericum exile (strain DSM 21853 / NBRC 104410 / AZM16c01) TaxID=511051 RepID=A0A7U6GDN9_CALEA|nr:MBL fold metallo-hydrolase [Caldisericum exile]BAL80505.1 hypothetical protein CSE_03790 [Caldisericum exile AZM16c01]
MMELKSVKSGIFYLEDSTNIGIIELNDGFLIIDAGIDKDKGKKIKRVLQDSGIKPTHLLLTHHHADHTGGASFLKEQFGLKVIASIEEKVFIENPILEPIYLSLGSSPNKNFLSKWVKSSEVKVDLATYEFDKLTYDDFEIINLSGHSIGMVGLKIENILFSADAFFSKEVLDKYIVPYFHDLEKFEYSLNLIPTFNYEFIIPSHGKAYTKSEGDSIIRYNIDRINEIKEKVFNTLIKPKTLQEILFNLEVFPHDPVTYTLIESSIRSILNYFINNDEIEQFVENEKLLYRRK